MISPSFNIRHYCAWVKLIGETACSECSFTQCPANGGAGLKLQKPIMYHIDPKAYGETELVIFSQDELKKLNMFLDMADKLGSQSATLADDIIARAILTP
jgi:hypothetical protein